MLKELFESIVTQAHKSSEPEQPKVIDELTSSDGRRVAFVYKGEIVERDVAPDPRNHHALSAASLVRMVQTCATDDHPMLFVSTAGIVAILDSERRERVTLELRTSDHFNTLKALPKAFGQRDAIAYLRRQLHGTGLENYADNLRQVVFERSQQSAGRSQRDQESMGKSIDAKVVGTQDLPEFLRGEIAIFDSSVFRAIEPITLGVDPRLQDELFDFWLPPNSLSDALHNGTSQLIDYLIEELPDATIVRGTV